MRIAVVGANQGVVGGAEVYLRWLLPDLVALGNEVGFAYEQPAAHPERAADLGVEPLVRWNLQHLGRERFLEELTAFAPDVVYLQSAEDAELDLALSTRFRAVLFAHAYYATCATGLRAHRLPARVVCERSFGPPCLLINYLRGCGVRHPGGLVRGYRLQSRRLGVLARVKAVVVASRYVGEVYEKQGVPSDSIARIPYPATGVTRSSQPPVAKPATDRVLFLGRLTPLKGLGHAVLAVSQASRRLGRPLTLVVAGEGPERARAEQLARAERLPVEFLGWIDGDGRGDTFDRVDALILPSLWPEPFGMVGLEAGCAGIPAVGYAVGGIPDWLRPGVSGELALGPAFDTSALADALYRALCDDRHRQALREGAWRVAGEYTPESHRERLLDVFSRAAGAP